MKNQNIGTIITDMLILVIEIKKFKNVLIRAELLNYNTLDKNDKVFITNSVYEIVNKLIFIDYIIKQIDEDQVTVENPFIRNLIRQAIYFIYFDKEVEYKTIVDNSVSIIKKKYNSKISKSVKNIIKTCVEDNDKISLPTISEEIEYLSIVYSYPIWIIKYWINVYDFDTVLKICYYNSNNFNKVKTNFVLNDSVKEKEIILKEIYNENSEIIKDKDTDIYSFSNVNNLSTLEAYENGLLYSINKSKAMAVDMLKLKENSSVLNMVSKNGSLSFYCLKKMNYQGNIISLDSRQENIKSIQRNKSILKIRGITERLEDCQQFNELYVNKFDYIILDAPSSELGLIRKNPISKYKYEFLDITELVSVQRIMLENASKYLKENGKILYLTNTISRKENVENMNWFVENFNFEIKELHQIMPFDYENADSTFVSLLERKKRRNNG